MRRLSVLVMALVIAAAVPAWPLVAPQGTVAPGDAFHRPLDELLDLYVRDGYVYYRAMKSDRGRLDRYVAALDVPSDTYARWSRDHQLAFWLNAYNAFVLRTVLDAYPIRGRSDQYPAVSIRQISGAFERRPHRAAGRSVTLDEIEKTVLPEFKEPRVYLALGRGALGSGRLRSEAYTGGKLEAQLRAVQAEFVNDQSMLRIDRLTGRMTVTPIISWREAEFVAAYDKGAEGPYAQRSPVERAVIAFIAPNLFRLEREFVEKNAFQMAFHDFDWRLNDLSGGRVD
jgi:hypothetical protein